MTIAINDKALADFHIHTTLSDGIIEPLEILKAVHKNKKSKLRHLCFTDHNDIRAIDKVRVVKDWYGIDVLPGVEISVSDFKCFHILGIGMNEKTEMNDVFSKMTSKNDMLLLRIFSKIKEAGIFLEDEFIKEMMTSSTVNRERIAVELVRKGYVRNLKKAYKEFIPACNDEIKTKISAKEIIGLINRSGGVASIAHPYTVRHKENGQRLNKDEWERLLDELVGYGLKGVECFNYNCGGKAKHCFFDSHTKNFNLLRVGGSDFHGNRKGDMLGEPNIKQKDIDKLLTAIEASNRSILKT